MNEPDLDLEELRASFRVVLDDLASPAEVRAHVDTDATVLAPLHAKAAELGWFGLTAPEAYGGLELGFDAAAVLYQELGRVVAPLPMLGALLAVQAITTAGGAVQQSEWLPRLASGAMLAGIGAAGLAPAWDEVRLTRRSGAVVLDGQARNLLDGAAAKLLLIAAREANGAPAWVLATPEDGVAIKGEGLVDRTRGLASADFAAVTLPASRVLDGDAQAVAETLLAHASLALACESIGGARAILETTVAYLKIREQFGKPIGSFQALKHRCAEHKVALEAADALVAHAVLGWTARESDTPLRAAFAKPHACDAFAAIATDAVQLHGGIGFTWEHECHLYLKRAKLNQVLFGGADSHRDHAARLLLAA